MNVVPAMLPAATGMAMGTGMAAAVSAPRSDYV
jgi:hypothetical protein